MPKLPMLKDWAVLTTVAAVLWLSSTSAFAQVYWGQRAQPLPNPAPQISQGPQAFRPNPYLGMPQQPPSNYGQPQQPRGGFNGLNMHNGTMTTCRVYGNQVTCF